MNFETWVKVFMGSLMASWIDTIALASVERFSAAYYTLLGIDAVFAGLFVFLTVLFWAGRVD